MFRCSLNSFGSNALNAIGLDPLAPNLVGSDFVAPNLVDPDSIAPNPTGLDCVAPNPVGPDVVELSPEFDIVVWQSLFGESNWSLLPPSPSLDVLVLDCVLESTNPACIHVQNFMYPICDSANCVSEVSLVCESANCIFEVLLSNSDCGSDEVDPVGVNSVVQPCHFLPLDPSLVKRVKELKRGKWYKNNNWAVNCLNAWRKEVQWELTPITKMKYLDLAKVLLKFFLCVCKDSGNRYPSGSIRNFHKSFNRILRDAHRVWIAETKIAEEPFSIEMNPFFLEVSSIVVAAMEKSCDSGVNIGQKKTKCLSFAEEAMILKLPPML